MSSAAVDDFPFPASRSSGRTSNRTKTADSIRAIPSVKEEQDDVPLQEEQHSTPEKNPEHEGAQPVDLNVPGDGDDAAARPIQPCGIEEVRADNTKKKTKFHGDVFAYREPYASPRDRVSRDSMITAEVTTNVIVSPSHSLHYPPHSCHYCPRKASHRFLSSYVKKIHQVKDEYTFLTTLTSHLATRFQRPLSSIAISLSHSACLIYAGSFDPAYILTLTALAFQVQPTTNKRNAALVQAFVAKSLNVPASRGVLRFVGVQEADWATNGVTMLGEIEERVKIAGGSGGSRSKPNDRDATEDKAGSKHIGSKANGDQNAVRESPARYRMAAAKKSSVRELIPSSGPHSPPPSAAHAAERDSVRSSVPSVPELPAESSTAADRMAEKVRGMAKKKSFLQIFGK
ncbi:hypothetical protein MMC19_002339 [Ptychographa xylographoides]|nr:hypothetical protein [Ptychographa xylographoides]